MWSRLLSAVIAQTQQATKVYRVGALFNRAPNQEDRDVEILKEGLARLGYVEGSNLVIEARFAEGNLIGFRVSPRNSWPGR